MLREDEPMKNTIGSGAKLAQHGFYAHDQQTQERSHGNPQRAADLYFSIL
jgi:hypothetical protein